MPLKLGVPRETAKGERRVAIDPTVISKLTKLGVEVYVEQGAGESALIPDSQFKGAILVSNFEELCASSDIIWRVQAPTSDEVKIMREGTVLISNLMAHNNIAMLKSLQDKKITSYGMELIPRISRAQSMDVLSSQAAIAGYKAAIMGADIAPRFFPMLTTAAGTIRPSKVIVIGVGVAGLQAIATAKRLGAVVEAYDVRPETKEQIESLGAKAIELKISAVGKGGYARELSAEEREQQQQELATYIAQADVLITTAQVPGKPAPKIIPQSTVEGMKEGAVIIDLAAEGGGNCALTKPGETIKHGSVVIHGPLDVASQVPIHASEMFAKNLFNFTQLLIDESGNYVPNYEDEIVIGALLTKDGEVMHEGTVELLNKTLGER
ncbi:NAD(P) transhydrogenase subunit alpha [Cocleimonas sp. KMM 6892]|uniref:NAD(P) transhydrogenase subunit alpha n=1 Tax=unclassified Cocleimonas TaxID=2639732 RepID=UPI002DB65315|nr:MULTISPECIES: NAD(P) transhydrogenase subunit alpha [unclassified Cocleimonas]MEB8431145.1 NAD(P) transhydrogenase subunit alpha [Cocleimonas sp. KMM 6892]MEC4714083.1 NAD(P) transhydrogenase subunit alpha [Cocleimonas sp. KMM 6895]MEC4743414.1 NAD(P) transhydrogenase subunit alpha [Cocleimonas sp. KMM 6896]